MVPTATAVPAIHRQKRNHGSPAGTGTATAPRAGKTPPKTRYRYLPPNTGRTGTAPAKHTGQCRAGAAAGTRKALIRTRPEPAPGPVIRPSPDPANHPQQALTEPPRQDIPQVLHTLHQPGTSGRTGPPGRPEKPHTTGRADARRNARGPVRHRPAAPAETGAQNAPVPGSRRSAGDREWSESRTRLAQPWPATPPALRGRTRARPVPGEGEREDRASGLERVHGRARAGPAA